MHCTYGQKRTEASLALKEQEFTANGEKSISYSDGKWGCIDLAEFNKRYIWIEINYLEGRA